MSLVDETIRLAGREIRVLRTTGKFTDESGRKYDLTYSTDEETGVASGKSRLDPYTDYEVFMQMMTDSGIVPGEVAYEGNDYYLAAAVEPRRAFGALEYYLVKFYKCNIVAKVYGFNKADNKHNTLLKSDVHALITESRSRNWQDDRSVALRRGGGYDLPFSLVASTSDKIAKNTVVEDQTGKRYKLSTEFDFWVSEGILKTDVVPEI